MMLQVEESTRTLGNLPALQSNPLRLVSRMLAGNSNGPDGAVNLGRHAEFRREGRHF